jgi:hypothetical protein
VQRRRADSAPIQLIDLILHEGDQRGHDQRRAGEHQRRQLEANRFAEPCRHHGQEISIVKDRSDERLLTTAKRCVAKVTVKGNLEISHRAAPLKQSSREQFT